MGRKSSIYHDLPADVLEQFHALVREGRHTVDDIRQSLESMGYPRSRSAVGRAVQSANKTLQKYRLAQETAKVWLDRMEAEPEGDVGRLLPQMLAALAHQTLDTLGESDDATAPKELAMLARAIKDLSGADKARIDIERVLRGMRKQARAAAEEVGKTMQAAGVSEAAVRQARERILGITG